MFIKENKSKNHTYLQIVESYREKGKNKHRILFNLGRLDKLQENDQLYKLAQRLMALSKHQPLDAQKMLESGRYKYGHTVFKKIWNNIDLSSILQQIQSERKFKYNLTDVVYYLTINRLLNPSSKLAAYFQQSDYIGLPNIKKLDHIYYALDILADYKYFIEQKLFERYKDLFNQKLDIIFYDVTTFHFESVRADELRDFGFSKAGKFNEVQVVFGLLVDKAGRPVGYDLFEGNTAEGSTLLSMVDKMKERFDIDHIVLVADKGITSKKNLHLIRKAGYGYIVSSSLRKAKKAIKEQVFDQTDYQQITDDKTGVVSMKYKSLEHHFTYKDEEGHKHSYSDKLLVNWTKNRAEKNAKDRARHLEKAQKKLAEGTLNVNTKKGFKKYIATEGKKQIQGIDTEKIKEEMKWDGYYGIQYAGVALKAEEIMKQYHFLWKIEESFRVLKTTMKTRPIFHWTPKRIKGHFMLCFIAFLIERTLETNLVQASVSFSPEKIKKIINELQVSEIEIEGQSFYLKGSHSKEASSLLKALKIKPIKNFQAVEDFKF